MKPLIAGSDFYDIVEPPLQSISLVFGDGGTGKTTFALEYAPEPAAFFSYDQRGRHVIKRAKDKGRRILPVEINIPANVTRLGDEQARKIGQQAIDKTIKNLEIAVRESQKGNVRTITLDTGTEYSEILSLAIRGRVDRTKGDYGKSKDLINREWWRIFNLAREGNAHLIILARAKAIWVNNEPTGNFSPRGPEVMMDAVDWAGQIRLKQRKGKLKKEFELEITKAGVNIEELGSVYTASDWEDFGGPFVYACWQQYEGSEPEDWM